MSATDTNVPPGAAQPAESTDVITHALARLAVETRAEEIPTAARAAARMAMLDALGCAAAGHDAPGVGEVTDLALYWGGREESRIWFRNRKVPSPAAAFVNSVQLHALDFDDYHPPSDAHVTSALVPAVLAVGEAVTAPGRDVLAALVVGCEVVGRMGRVCMARRVHKGFLPASVIGGFGAVAAACRLLGCSVAETAAALGIWYADASGNRQALFDRTLTKRIQPGIAARGGVVAAHLARAGITGPHRIVGGAEASLTRLYGYDREPSPTVDDVMAPRTQWAVQELNYKTFACCGVSVPAMLAAISLAEEHGLVPEQVAEVRVFGPCVESPFGNAAWTDHPTPQVLAQFCVPYAVASAIRNRRFGPEEIAPARIAADHEVDALARRIRLCQPEQGRQCGNDTTVEVVLRDGRRLKASSLPGGRCLTTPADDERIIDKFKRNVEFSGLVDAAAVDGLVEAILDLESCGNIIDFTASRYLVGR
ncbi:MAG: hypothetical protein A3K19_01950 [Lentisphaerae bacterium RIFOXYB12_FULL_65_16]|nr:MAG: hypothetical protein A3K18_29445 [Lentisphaerae bacterium RIFOXYA12_64_32]OGV92641.1 MAG: hypothetical protein A3K19_01950 [Lentisphaerae bacterium RIFOXYB12_FULL_65_16]